MFKKKSKYFLILAFIIIFCDIKLLYSEPYLELDAKAAILIEQKSGKVLYSKNENEKMYPASMTKILTAIIALEYIKPDEIIFSGTEIKSVPFDSSKAGNIVGEAIRGDNLIRLLIIPSGNDTACIVAQNVAEKVTGNADLPYSEAEKIFSNLMNEKAKSLGATNSNFVNPHGYHNENHYTTAYDMALISRAAMENELIQRVVAEKEFVGNGAGENPDPSWKTKEYSWKTHNLLIGGGEYAYEYATGIKTGFTDEASDCVSASAKKDNVSLINVVLDSDDPGRWEDSIKLFEYGFNTFSYKAIQSVGQELGAAVLSNNKLGESDLIKVVAKSEFIEFLSNEEANKIQSNIEYKEEFIEKNEDVENVSLKLKAPINKGDILGKITYTLDGKEIFSDDVLAERDVEARSFQSDFLFYFNKTKNAVFSIDAIPFWIASIVAIAITFIIVSKIRSRRNRNFYKLKKRY